jgi:hypothetical protein
MKKNTLILKESELIDFISTTVMKVVKEQEDGIFKLNPNVPLDVQMADKSGLKYVAANQSPQSFVSFWFDECGDINKRKGLANVKSITNNTSEAIYCFDRMPKISKDYLQGTNRREIAILWINYGKKIMAKIEGELIPKMSGYGDQSNFNNTDRNFYAKHQNLVDERWIQMNHRTLPDSDWIGWKYIEYTADVIGIVAIFFGPVGWIVSGVAGMVSAFSMYQQGNVAGAGLVVLLELFPVVKLIKHFKHVKHFKGMGDEVITNGLKFFEEPTEIAYKALTKSEKELVEYIIKKPEMVKSMLKVTNSSKKAKNLILNVKDMKEFWAIASSPKGKKYGLDKIGWNEFKKLQDSLREAETILIKIKNGIPQASAVLGTLVVGGYAFIKLQNWLNKQWASYKIGNTEDYISSELYGDKWFYRFDRVVKEKYPYTYHSCRPVKKEEGFMQPDCTHGVPNNYKEYLLTDGEVDPIWLLRLWYNKQNYPELRNLVKAAPDGRYSNMGSCVGVDLPGSPNPGGGWRPNLNCVKGFTLGADTEAEKDDFTESFLNISYNAKTEDELRQGIKDIISPDLPNQLADDIIEGIKKYEINPNLGVE